VTPAKVEGVVDEPVLPTSRQLGLQFGEIGSALMDDHHFPVDDGLAWDVEGAGNQGSLWSSPALLPALMWTWMR
jgi:hypothetical protein